MQSGGQNLGGSPSCFMISGFGIPPSSFSPAFEPMDRLLRAGGGALLGFENSLNPGCKSKPNGGHPSSLDPRP